MAWYASGSVALTNGNATVIGTGTSFLTKVKPGDMFVPDDGANAFYEIAEITSALQLVLKKPYAGASAPSVTYVVVPTQSFLKELATQVTDLITIYSDVPANVEAAEAAMTEAQAARSAAVNAQTASEAARDAAEVWKAAAAASAQSASLSAADAGTAQAAAEVARDEAQTAQGVTLAARDVTLAARDAASASEAAAANSATQAAQAASDAAVNLTEVTATADNALSVAQGIDGKAQTALDNSAAAVSTANAAQSTANGIDSKAQTALDNSAAATSTANAAQSDVDALEGVAIRKDGSVQFTGHQKLKDNAPTDPLHASSKGYVDAAVRMTRVEGLTMYRSGTNNISLSADAARVRDASGDSRWIGATGGLVINMTTQGANGRDQAAAFLNQWTHAFIIWGASVAVAGLSSLSSTAPTLPSGYTHFAYCGPVRVVGSNNTPFQFRCVGDEVQYNWDDAPTLFPSQQLTGSQQATGWPTMVPPNATNVHTQGSMTFRADTAGNFDGYVSIRNSGDSNNGNAWVWRMIGMAASSDNTMPVFGTMLNTSSTAPTVTYALGVGAGYVSFFLGCRGFRFRPTV